RRGAPRLRRSLRCATRLRRRGRARVRAGAGRWLPRAGQPRDDAETQTDAVLYRDRAAEERIGRDAEIGLLEREPPGHAYFLRVGLDLRRHLQGAHVAVQRDRDGERRFLLLRVRASDADQG